MFSSRQALDVIKRNKVKTVLAAAVATAIAYPVVKIAAYEQSTSAEHLQAKNVYLNDLSLQSATLSETERPNIVFMVLDDMGYGDLSSYGSKAIQTPNIDALAAGGLKLNNYYTAAPSSTPSRASMMTGRYPQKSGLIGVVWPEGHPLNNALKLIDLTTYMPEDEILLPEIMKASGYQTSMIGKWHIGEAEPAKPHNRGYEEFYGAYFSNDMPGYTIWHNEDVAIPTPVDQTKLNAAYFDKAESMIENYSDDKPFFMYFAHAFPHVPLFAPEEELGKSDAGLYGDVMRTIDDRVGQMVEKLKAEGKYENTVFVITSDNGAWFDGDAGDTRGRKFTTFDGGQRVPFIVSWPAKIKQGQEVDSLVSGVDMLPTFAALAGVKEMPQDRIIDGFDLTKMFKGDIKGYEANNSNRKIWFPNAMRFDAFRDDNFKYRGPYTMYSNGLGDAIDMRKLQEPNLYDYAFDMRESYDVTLKYPEITAKMAKELEAKNQEIIDNPRGWK